MIKIALDIMGGDKGVTATVGGMVDFLSKSNNTEVFFNLFGDSNNIKTILKNLPKINENLFSIHHTEKTITNEIKVMSALKSKEGTSMFEAIRSVANNESDAVVSSGNTGVYMAMSKILLNTIEGIDRPALITTLPNINKRGNIVLDLGANMDCSPQNLLQFAIMGDATAKAMFSLNKPKIGLLNVGTEKTKGTDTLKEAYRLIASHKNLNFIGFIEGTDITNEVADVIITDGFSGNIVIKSMEGAFKYIANVYEKEVRTSLLGKLSYLCSLSVLKKIKKTLDTRIYNGAPLVGLNGIAVKSHGSSDAKAFSQAISVTVKLIESKFIESIRNNIGQKL